MAAEFVIAGRHALPDDAPWELEMDNDDGGIVVYTPEKGDEEYRAYVRRIVGFDPASIMIVRKAWDCAQVVAEVIAEAVEGCVFCDFDNGIVHDAKGHHVSCSTRKDLERKMKHAFAHPEPYFRRWEKEERASFTKRIEEDPKLAAENDWSDVDE